MIALVAAFGRRVSSVSNAWMEEIPPHSYSLLRIALGSMCLVSLAGMTPVSMFWSLDGLAPPPAHGTWIREWIDLHGYSTIAGWFVFAGLLTAFTAMMVGFRSDVAVLASFIGLVGQTHWNNNPLSSAHQVLIVLTFCLVWSDSGRVWSVDAWRTKVPDGGERRTVAWPLMLMRCQVALIYFASGLHKISYPMWRDGSAVYWALNLNAFHRFPWTIPEAAAPLFAFLTWSTLLFELTFPILVYFRPTRVPVLLAGIGLHIGLGLTMELGPFSPIMIASYIAFLDPWRTPRLVGSHADLSRQN